MKEKKKTMWGTASLVNGIVGLCLVFLPYFGVILSILAIVFSGIQKKHGQTGSGTAGLVLGIVGTAMNFITLFFIALLLIGMGA